MVVFNIIFQKSKNSSPEDDNEFWLSKKLDSLVASSHLPLSYKSEEKKKGNMKLESVVVSLTTTPCQNVYSWNHSLRKGNKDNTET